MSSDDIVERLRNWDDGRVSTHYEGCWDSHPVCAILLAADEIERLRAEFSAVLGDAIAKDAEVGAADALANTLRALVAEQHHEIERLRAALAAWREVADGLADTLSRFDDPDNWDSGVAYVNLRENANTYVEPIMPDQEAP